MAIDDDSENKCYEDHGAMPVKNTCIYAQNFLVPNTYLTPSGPDSIWTYM